MVPFIDMACQKKLYGGAEKMKNNANFKENAAVPVILTQLQTGPGAFPGSRIDQPDGTQRAERERVFPALRQDLDRKASLEKRTPSDPDAGPDRLFKRPQRNPFSG